MFRLISNFKKNLELEDDSHGASNLRSAEHTKRGQLEPPRAGACRAVCDVALVTCDVTYAVVPKAPRIKKKGPRIIRRKNLARQTPPLFPGGSPIQKCDVTPRCLNRAIRVCVPEVMCATRSSEAPFSFLFWLTGSTVASLGLGSRSVLGPILGGRYRSRA